MLKADIANCGGSYTAKVSQATHVIATRSQVDRKLSRVEEALRDPNVTVVSYDWLAASLASNQGPVDTQPYLLDNSAGNGADGASDLDASPTATTSKKSAKRPRQDDDDDEDAIATKKTKQSSQAITNNMSVVTHIKVPLDEYVPDPSDYKVYIDETGIVYDAILNKSNAGANNNKFYKIQIIAKHGEYFTWTRWGRVGEKGQSKRLGEGDLGEAMAEFKGKFKEKSGMLWEDRDHPPKKNKYSFLEINYEDSDDEQVDQQEESPKKEKGEIKLAESKLSKEVQRLIELIFNLQLFSKTMAALDYDANRMPLGKLSKKTLLKGYEVLKDLASLITDPSLANNMGVPVDQTIADRSNQYFSLVPHVVGRKALPILRDMDSIKVSARARPPFRPPDLLI